MAEMELQQVFKVGDQTFDSRQEAMDFIRKPKVLAALDAVTNGNRELSEWIYAHQDLLVETFEAGTITRVTKSERKQLETALERVKEIFRDTNDKKLSFLADNAGAVLEVFRWPTVKRMSPEEKEVLINTSLMGATENNEDLVKWIKASKDAIFDAFDAGKPKPQVSDKATNALAAYRAKKAQEKAEKEAPELGITVEEYLAKSADEIKALREAKKNQ